ncbi:MAG: hypothetical protein CSA26_07135 [Desulfobacterales bacterium]|nr:MAG: hypothetical protein CSA26_07135 [Desulfobacterales bacterium]
MKINLIKIGGSVISRESSPNKFDHSLVAHLAEQLQPFRQGLILVHGTGFVGKPPALTYGYYKTGKTQKKDSMAMIALKEELRLLNHRFVETLLAQSLPAIPFTVSQTFTPSMDGLKAGAETDLYQALDSGFVPVFYGDLITCGDGCFRVFSSDLITLLLSEVVKPDNTIFLSDVEGVYHKNTSEPIGVLNSSTAAELEDADGDRHDVSGGMSAKVAHALKIAAYSGKCFIGSGMKPEIVGGFLRGEQVRGTRVEAGNDSTR